MGNKRDITKISQIIIHCTATLPTATVDSIKKYWKEVLEWQFYGYHFLIDKDGVITNLVPVDEISNGASGYNYISIHISYIGGVLSDGKTPSDTRTDKQKAALKSIVKELRAKYPQIKTVLGHRDLPGVRKACPSFDTSLEF